MVVLNTFNIKKHKFYRYKLNYIIEYTLVYDTYQKRYSFMLTNEFNKLDNVVYKTDIQFKNRSYFTVLLI